MIVTKPLLDPSHIPKHHLIAPARAKLGGMLPTNMVRFCRPVPSLTTCIQNQKDGKGGFRRLIVRNRRTANP